jgi:hypothetical protein
MSIKGRMKAADPLRAASHGGLPMPDFASMALTPDTAVRYDPERRRAPLRQVLATSVAVIVAAGVAAIVLAVIPRPGDKLHPAGGATVQPGSPSSIVPFAPTGPLGVLRFSQNVSGAPSEHVSGVLRYRIPRDWHPLRQTENSMAFTTRLEGCVATITVSAHPFATSESPKLQVHAVLYQYKLLASGPRRRAPTGPWAVGFSDGTKQVVRNGYNGPLAPGMTSVSVMPLARANRYLQFRVYAVTCGPGQVHARDVLKLGRDFAGVLANVYIQQIAGQPPLG